MSRYLIILSLLFSIIYTCAGQHKIIGVDGTDWHNPLHWIPDGVATANDSVLVFGAAFIEPDSTARALHVQVHESSYFELKRDLLNNKGAKLIIKNSPGQGLLNEGIILNGGRITINNTQDNAVRNEGSFTTLNQGKIKIDSTGDLGIFNNPGSVFRNNGEITINNTASTSFLCQADTLFFGNLSNVIITNSKSHGITMTSEYAENQGYINIDSCEFSGIILVTKFTNLDTINITNGSSDLFFNMDTFINESTGYVYLDNTPDSDIGYMNDFYTLNKGQIIVRNTQDGIFSSSSFMNDGVISLNDCHHGMTNGGGFFNNGHFSVVDGDIGIFLDDNGFVVNTDTITIDSTKEYGVMNGDSLHNKSGAFISIRGLHMNDAVGWENPNTEDILINEGKIFIYDTDSNGIVNNGIIINHDSLELNRTDHSAILNMDSLFNTASGTLIISVSNGSDAALTNAHIEATVRNEGKIHISNCEGFGIHNENGSFTNYDSLIIDNVIDLGIYNFSTFRNHSGAITINDVSKSAELDMLKGQSAIAKSELIERGGGINNRSLGTSAFFENNAHIHISDIFYGIVNSGVFISNDTLTMGHCKTLGLNMSRSMSVIPSSFTNNGFLDIKGDKGVEIRSVFINGASGHLVIHSGDDEYFECFLNSEFLCDGTMEMIAPDNSGAGN